LNSDLEEDFRNHKKMLLELLSERKGLLDESRDALELDKQICKVESVVRSYQTVKWYEQEAHEKKLLAHQAPSESWYSLPRTSEPSHL